MRGQIVNSFVMFLIILFFISSVTTVIADVESSPVDINEDPYIDLSESEISNDEDLIDFSLEDLMDIQIGTSALTKTTKRKSPSTITTITQEDIRRSGARSLMDVLDIYVPNFMWIHDADGQYRNMGLRGSISFRDNKYLLLVNGRCMNEKTDFGVFSERDLPMMTDIHHIDVVRGPGSTLYGPGAMMMVINIITESPDTFQGFETTNRFGAIEDYYSTEFKYGRKFSDDSGLYLYSGYSKYKGSSLDHGLGGIEWNSDDLKPLLGQRWNTKHMVYRGNRYEPYNKGLGPKMKFHAQYHNGNFKLWGRYTQGGEYLYHASSWTYITRNWRDKFQYGVGYKQATITAEYLQEFSPNLSMEYTFSYDRFEVRTFPRDYFNAGYVFFRNFREDEYFGRALLRWQPHKNHSLAFGFSASHEIFGLPPDGADKATFYQYMWNYPGRNMSNPGMSVWTMNMFSMLGEYQWTINNQWTIFLSGRLDDHEYADHAWSPRGSIVFTPTKKDTIKLIGARSLRMNNASTMISGDAKGNPNADVETFDSFEIRYERQHNKKLWFAIGAFTNRIELVEYNGNVGGIAPMGHEEIWGLEVEITRKTDKSRVTFSHAYTKLHDIKYEPGIGHNKHSVAPFGYGDDLQNWFNNITKIHAMYEFDEQWSIDGSLICNWDNPGGEDTVDYAIMEQTNPWRRNDTEDEAPFGPHFYMNFGIEYRHSKNLLFRFDAHNVLGWLDTDVNLRRIGMNSHRTTAALRVPPSLSFQIKYTF